MQTDLMNIIYQEFEKLGKRIDTQINARAGWQDPSCSYNRMCPTYSVDIAVVCGVDEINCFKPLASEIRVQGFPFVDFDDMENRIVRGSDTSLEMPFEFKRRIEYRVIMNVYLDEPSVYTFLRMLRDKTEPILRKKFERDFDKEVEDHLTDNEYNGVDGHQ